MPVLKHNCPCSPPPTQMNIKTKLRSVSLREETPRGVQFLPRRHLATLSTHHIQTGLWSVNDRYSETLLDQNTEARAKKWASSFESLHSISALKLHCFQAIAKQNHVHHGKQVPRTRTAIPRQNRTVIHTACGLLDIVLFKANRDDSNTQQ